VDDQEMGLGRGLGIHMMCRLISMLIVVVWLGLVLKRNSVEVVF